MSFATVMPTWSTLENDTTLTLYNSPDSGYHTGSPPTTYTPNTATITPTKLNFSPIKRKKNDIFIPKTPKSSKSPPKTPHQPTPPSQKQPNLSIIKPPPRQPLKNHKAPLPLLFPLHLQSLPIPLPTNPNPHKILQFPQLLNLPPTHFPNKPLTYPYKPSSTIIVINPDALTAYQDYDPVHDFVPKYNKFAQPPRPLKYMTMDLLRKASEQNS